MAFNTETAKQGGEKSKRGSDKELKQLRSVFTELLEENKPKLNKWLNSVADTDPSKALDLYIKMTSFILPKPRSIELDNIENKEQKIINLGNGINPLEREKMIEELKYKLLQSK